MQNESGLELTADKVLLKPLPVQEKTLGGVLIAPMTKEREELAQIVSIVVGIGRTAALCPEMDGIEIGDTVLHARYTGMEIPVDGVRYRVARAGDIVGKATRPIDSVLRGARSSAEVFPVNNPLAVANG